MDTLTVQIMKVDVPNHSKRIYSRHETERALLDINQDSITRGRVFGQVGMPDGASCLPDIDRMSHIVGNFRITEQSDLLADVAWLGTEAGAKARALYEAHRDIWFFRPALIGKIIDGRVIDFRIKSINMVLNGT